MRSGIAAFIIAVVAAAVVVPVAIWQPLIGGLLGAAWIAAVCSHLASGDRRFGWLRGALAGMFWFAVSPILIICALWLVVELPSSLFGRHAMRSGEILKATSRWMPYAQSIGAGIVGGICESWMTRQRREASESDKDDQPSDSRGISV
jgi:hypothetical protein